MMNNNTIYEEIKNHILSRLSISKTVRIATINAHCGNEGIMFKVLQSMKAEKLIDYDDNFIWKV